MHRETICKAVRARNVLKLRYDDDLSERGFAGHVLWEADTENIILSGYNYTKGKIFTLKDWRNLDTALIKSFTVTNSEFTPYDGFDPRSKTYDGKVICHVFQDRR